MGGQNTSIEPARDASDFVNNLHPDSSYDKMWNDLMSWDNSDVPSEVLRLIPENTPFQYLKAARNIAVHAVAEKLKQEYSAPDSNPLKRD